MEVRVHFLDVTHGDSIVVEVLADSPHYLVVDCRTHPSKQDPPVYTLLKSRRATRIDALMITHLHKDHFLGVERLFDEFVVERLLIPPIFSLKNKRFETIVGMYKKKTQDAVRGGDEQVCSEMWSLARLLKFIVDNRNSGKVEELEGKENILRLKGVNLNCRAYLPLPRLKSLIHQQLEKGKFSLDVHPDTNSSSIALEIEIGGRKCLLTGDSTDGDWFTHKLHMRSSGVECLNCDCIKAPHHGAKGSNTARFFDYVCRPRSDLGHVFVSADGITHPHQETLQTIGAKKLRPHCTNFSTCCLPLVLRGGDVSALPAEVRPFLSNYVKRLPIPCQGDMTLVMRPDGVCTIGSSTQVPCVYW